VAKITLPNIVNQDTGDLLLPGIDGEDTTEMLMPEYVLGFTPSIFTNHIYVVSKGAFVVDLQMTVMVTKGIVQDGGNV
jgi:hypothetical protein